MDVIRLEKLKFYTTDLNYAIYIFEKSNCADLSLLLWDSFGALICVYGMTSIVSIRKNKIKFML